MGDDDEQLGSSQHPWTLPDPSAPNQLGAEALADALRELARPCARGLGGRLIVPLRDRRVLIKRLSRGELRDRAFVVGAALDGLDLRLHTQVLEFEGELYELVDFDESYRPAASPAECEPLFALYEQAERITMLGRFVDFDGLLRGPHINKDEDRGDGHPAGPEASLDRVLAAIEPSLARVRPACDAGLRRGLVHGDLHRGNLLIPCAGQGPGLLIDLDPIIHSYAALNLAHLCVEEFVARPAAAGELRAFHARALASMTQADARAFDFIVLVELFRMLVKRGFHRDHYSDEWEDELLFLFEGYGVETYLAGVRPELAGGRPASSR